MSSKLIASSEIIYSDGIVVTVLHLTDEARAGLTVGGLPSSSPSSDEAPYRFRVQEGDYVRFPDGRLGTVYQIELPDAHSKVVSIRLDKTRRRFRGLLPAIPVRLADQEIDQLERIATKAELEAIDPDA